MEESDNNKNSTQDVTNAEKLKVTGLKSLLTINQVDDKEVPYSEGFEACIQYLKSCDNIKLKQRKVTFKKLPQVSFPCLVETKHGVLLLAGIKQQACLVQFPGKEKAEVITLEALQTQYNQQIIELAVKQSRFDVSWFVPVFLEHKSLFVEIFFFSFVLQILALASPLFFQVVMDKVMVHQALKTLDVLVFGLVVAGISEVLLRGMREYIYAHTANRVDVKLGLKLFTHVLGLPLLYFKNRQIGAIVMRIKELDTIREFITGAMFTLLVDFLFMGVFLYVMYSLSPSLTGVFCLSIPFYVLLTWWVTPKLQQRIKQQFTYSAINTSFLTESVAGAETVKSLAVEPRLQNQWNSQTTDIVEANYQTQTLNSVSSQGVQFIQKVTSVIILWVGAAGVLSLEITIGQLIAFNMMANHIAQPFARMVDLWSQYLQAQLAVEKLGEMLNLPTESYQEEQGADREQKADLKGDIVFKRIAFRYQPEQDLLFQSLSFTIKQGTSVGIVGTSGSGKSTLARLLLRLYTPENGDVIINGHNIKTININHLRERIGVVLQESFLFNKTVRDTIAQSRPQAALEEVIAAAKLAGAHDFILKLPKGYDTELSEGGSSLSGGQRQRIAIARTLLTSPDILILDEATSALDDESQSLIQKNMKQFSKGKTVIAIAHRLSTIRQCDQIIVMDQGRIIEKGSHEKLIQQGRKYAQLWQLQQELKQS